MGSRVLRTVLGPVETDGLGPALPHEHLIVDAVGDRGPIVGDAPEARFWDQPLTLENHYEYRRNWHYFRDNIVLESVEDTVEALARYHASGGSVVADVTPIGLGRRPDLLVEIARRTPVHIVMGTGFYVDDYMDDDVRQASIEALAGRIVDEIENGVGPERIRPGVIGEVGLSWPVTPAERRSLQACATASARTGLALSIHPGRHPRAPFEAVRIAVDAGADPSRIAIDHLDRTLMDVDALLSLAATGCWLEFDLFGLESSYYPWSDIDMPNDAGRVAVLKALAEAGHHRQLLASHDIDMKARLRKYGGEGYGHLLDHVVPLMEKRGLPAEVIADITTRNPLTFLGIDS